MTGRVGWVLPVYILVVAVLALAGASASVAPVEARAGVVFERTSATVDFPEAIEFTLDARADAEVTRLELLYRPVFSPVTNVVRPPFTRGRELHVVYRRDMVTNYLPPGIDIVYRWRVHVAGGDWVDSPEQRLLYLDQRYTWRTFADGPVQVFSAAADAAVGQHALTVTVDAVRRFSQDFGVDVEGPIRVVVYPSQRDLLGALPAQSAEWIGGFARPDLRLIVTGLSPGPGMERELRRVLSHEVVHLMVEQATHNPYNAPPAWLDEGLASYYQEVEDTRFDTVLQRAVRDGRLISVRALNSSFPVDPDTALLSYAESRSIVQFIIERYGEEGMAALLRVFRDGVSYDEAVERALGVTIEELDRAWKEWLGYPGDRMSGRVDDRTPALPPVDPTAALLAGAALASLAVPLVRRARQRHVEEPLPLDTEGYIGTGGVVTDQVTGYED